MKLEEIIYRMNNELLRQYGIENAIHTVVFDHKAFDEIVVQEFRKKHLRFMHKPSASSAGDKTDIDDPAVRKFGFYPCEANDLTCYGVRLSARKKCDL